MKSFDTPKQRAKRNREGLTNLVTPLVFHFCARAPRFPAQFSHDIPTLSDREEKVMSLERITRHAKHPTNIQAITMSQPMNFDAIA